MSRARARRSITIDGCSVPFSEGQTIMDAALAAKVYIPHLCHSPGFRPHGSCRLCTLVVNGRHVAACTTPAAPAQQVLNNTPELNAARRSLTQMLFVEGNHFCPSCEKSGDCDLQAVAYFLEMYDPHYPELYPKRELDASHPDVLLDRDRCILCELCVRASRDVDGKNVFGIGGRGIAARLIVNSATGKLGDTDLDVHDRAVAVCPVGAILVKRQGFKVPIGQRRYDRARIDVAALEDAQSVNRNG